MSSIQLLLKNKTPFFYQKNSPEVALYHGNCLELLDGMKENSVDMIFADPPYNLSNGGMSVHAGKRVSVNKGEWDKSKGIDADFEFHLKWIEACKRVLKDNGTIWISGSYHSIYQCGFALQKLGYHILNEISWYKPNAAPHLACRMFAAAHETLIWARKSKKAKHYFDYKAMKHGEWGSDAMKKQDKQMRSVWAINTPRPNEKIHGKHPTQKPVDLLERIVVSSTQRGDIVLDPFTGSSTTGVATYKHKRKFVGFDTEKKYLRVSQKRIQDLSLNNGKQHKLGKNF